MIPHHVSFEPRSNKYLLRPFTSHILMFSLPQLALPGVVTLVVFLAYGSQLLFRFIEPGPLTIKQTLAFNTFIGCLWVCYGRACFVDPGRVPYNWSLSPLNDDGSQSPQLPNKKRQRWCKRCEALKPPRTHHCKVCQRYTQKIFH